jgi:hypothetical protein
LAQGSAKITAMTNGLRLEYTLRWPHPEHGPLWLRAHWHERAGTGELVGLEVWTETPEQSEQDELVPWPPVRLQREHLESIALGRIMRSLGTALEGQQRPDLAPSSPYGPGRPALYPEAHWRLVAGVYVTAERFPARAVAEHFGVARTTAYEWIRRCRTKGLLPA